MPILLIDVIAPCSDQDSPMAAVDWKRAASAQLATSSTETQMLAIAHELAGIDSGRPLGDLISGLDQTNTSLGGGPFCMSDKATRLNPSSLDPLLTRQPGRLGMSDSVILRTP